ncbi:hypothetical protein, partial [Psychrobacter sp. TB20-MNA-CIBAN-0197]
VEGKDTQADEYLGAKQISPPKATANLAWQASDDIALTFSYLYVGDRKRFDKNKQGQYVGDQGPVSSYDIVNLSGQYQITPQWSSYF